MKTPGFSRPRVHRRAFALAVACLLLSHTAVAGTPPRARKAAERRPVPALRADAYATPRVALGDGKRLDVTYDAALLAGSRGRALASADFDEDGTPDLAAGYDVAGRGAVTVQTGNVD